MDALFSFCMNMAAWHWLSLGVAFLSIELMFPGIYMLWFGVGGLITSVFAYILGAKGAIAIFLFLIISSAISFFASKHQNKEPKFLVNNVKNMMIGKVITLENPIKNGQARVKIGDGHWTLTGSDQAAGTKVKVIEVSGNSLVVEELK